MQDQTGMKYFAVSLVALFADYVLTMALWQLTGLGLAVSAGISFVSIGLVGYMVHEFWTFRAEDSAFSGSRAAQNGLVLGLAFIARVATVASLEFLHAPNALLGTVYFILGAGISYCINYGLNRYWVFQR